MRPRFAVLALLLLSLAVPCAQAQDVACAVPAPAEEPAEDIGEHRRLSTGSGVTVAVIDTGVARHPELDQLAPGADYVTPDEPRPFQDCDAHGTVVAGIIAGTRTGVAPDATILSVRQSSAHFRKRPGPGGDPPPAETPAGDLETLARAIHHAVDKGADVINMSVVSCVEPAVAPRVDTAGLRRALARAEHENVVVVAAAGNANNACPPGSMVYPAHFPTVLAVGARADSHTLADYSLPVPAGQTELSAPGSPAAALSPTGSGWAAGLAGDRGTVQPFHGTSFAAPVVSGTVALLRQRYPDATAAQLRAIVEQAAEPSGGAVDPLRTVTFLEHAPAADIAPLTVTPTEEIRSGAPRRTSVALAILAVSSLLTAAAGSLFLSRRNI